MSDFKPPHGWFKVRRVSRYVPDTDMGGPWRWLGTHTRYEGVCPEHRQYTHYGVQGDHTDQTPTPIATLAQHLPPPDHRNPLRVGVYLVCGTVHWRDYQPPNREEAARTRREHAEQGCKQAEERAREREEVRARGAPQGGACARGLPGAAGGQVVGRRGWDALRLPVLWQYADKAQLGRKASP